MGPELRQPLWLLALPVAIALLVLARLPWWRAGWRMPTGSARRAHLRAEATRLGLRIGWIVLLVLARAELHLTRPLDRQAIVFVVDVSASMAPARDQAEALVGAALARLPRGDRAGVVASGVSARVEESPTERPLFTRLGTALPDAATDLTAGLRLAGALLPSGHVGRVVLISDGRQTAGDAVAAARELAARGTTVDVLPLGASAGPDIRLDSVDLPDRVHRGEVGTLTLRVQADQAATSTIRIYRDDRLVLERPVQLRSGRQEIALPLPAGDPGMHRYRVDLAADDPSLDATAANNALGAFQRVVGPPRVLVVARDVAAAGMLPAALRARGVEVAVTAPSGVPADLAGWAAYDAVIVVDVPAEAFPPGAMDLLESDVRDLGRGLAMTGGPDSFGPGGYAGTPVERALPVSVDLRGRGREPSVALVLVIDRSGSMAGAKMELAKEAALRSVRLLRPIDRAAVLAFDDTPRWVAPLTSVGERERIETAIGSISAGGGTEIYPAVEAGFAALRDAEAEVKHLILLTDGRSATGGPYGAVLGQMRQARVTLSTVAVGDDADSALLEAMARSGRGRYHFAAEPAAIPELFARETVLATRTILVEAQFSPAVVTRGPLRRGLGTVPPLDGYVAATAKDTAEVVLVSPDGDPVLAAWQYGLGRSVAWTSDVAGRWSGAWADQPAAATLWGNVISWLMPPEDRGDLTVRVETAPDGTVAIVAESQADWDGVRPTRATLLGPEGRRQEIELRPAGPGRYAAELGALAPGAYIVQAAEALDRGVRRGEIGYVAPYPAEYRQTGIDRALLVQVAAAGGGRVLDDPAATVVRIERTVATRWPAWPLLLGLAAVVWPIEIATRRLTMPRRRPTSRPAVVPGRSSRGPVPRPAPAAPPAATTAERLLDRKRAFRQRFR